MESSGILEVIAERTANTEQCCNSSTVREKLNETLRIMARREKSLRESTIMFKLSEAVTPPKVSDLVESSYCNVTNKPSASYWQDKEYAYAQFINQEEKTAFLDWIILNNVMSQFRDAIQLANDEGEHVQRKPIRLMINNVRRILKEEIIERGLKRIFGEEGDVLQNFRQGKPNAITGARSIMFNTNEAGFRKLFGTLEGSIPYVNNDTNTKTKLYLKINCKPWACKDCFAFGVHQCQDKSCAKCGIVGHQTKDCKSKTKFCSNCKRKGHRAKDTHCMTYLA